MINPLFHDEFHAEISPVPAGSSRPIWSVLIPSYNCAGYLKETLQSVLVQDPGPDKMEIIVVDGHSTQDDPGSVVAEYGQGRVRFVREDANRGRIHTYATGLSLSTGQLIHQLHGDDKVRPGFYNHMEKLFQDHPLAGAGFCRSLYIDGNSKWRGMTGMEQEADGILPNFLEKIVTAQRVQTPAMVVRRAVYETLGGFDMRQDRGQEDWEMWIRIACFFPVAFSTEVLAEYRVHQNQATQRDVAEGSSLRAYERICCIVDRYIPAAVLAANKQKRNFEMAQYTLMMGVGVLGGRGGFRARLPYLYHALRLSCRPRIVIRVLRALYPR